MLTPISGHENLTRGSNKKVLFSCSCGNKEVYKIWKYFTNGITKTCGECNALDLDHWASTKYGSLRMKSPVRTYTGSNKKTFWMCDCGNECESRVIDVTRGFTKSCGSCNLVDISGQKFGKLSVKEPTVVSRGSHTTVMMVCDCGNEVGISAFNILSGNSKSCGGCKDFLVSDFYGKKFGSLLITSDGEIRISGREKISCICDCGNEKDIVVSDVVHGRVKSCGQCNAPDIEFWSTTKFGKLKLKEPAVYHLRSHKKSDWTCNCGNDTIGTINSVTYKKKTSCGNCIEVARGWFKLNELTLKKLTTPIKPDDIPPGLFKSLEDINNVRDNFKCVCWLCGEIYEPQWQNIRRGVSLTCGCSTGKVSSGQKELFDFVLSLGVDAQLEYEVNGLKYDVGVESQKILIEFNGLRWHSFSSSKNQDTRKYNNAVKNDWQMISIYEDEWAKNRVNVEKLIRNRLSLNKSRSLRPSKCEITPISHLVADPFYKEHHYIGACKSNINYGVFHDGKLVACASFKRPTRQNTKHDWELVRMTSSPEFRVHGIWSKILSRFVSEYKPISIVSYSDNRLFNGKVYEKIGFKYDGDVTADYYWVMGSRRFHKSALRKKGLEKSSGKTETVLREEQGYRKIYDLGKKRWIYSV